MSIYDIYFSNFGRPPVPDDLHKDSPMTYTKIQPQGILVSEEEDF